MTKWAKTAAILAQEMGISRQALYAWMRKPGFPERTKNGFSVSRSLQYVLEQKRAAESGRANVNVKDRRATLECEVLQAKLDRLQENVVPVVAVRDLLLRYAGIVNQKLDEFVNRVAVTTKNPSMVAIAKTLRDQTRAQLATASKKLPALTSAVSDEESNEGLPGISG